MPSDKDNVVQMQDYIDPMHIMALDVRNWIRAQFALAQERVQTWEPRPCPPKQRRYRR